MEKRGLWQGNPILKYRSGVGVNGNGKEEKQPEINKIVCETACISNEGQLSKERASPTDQWCSGRKARNQGKETEEQVVLHA